MYKKTNWILSLSLCIVHRRWLTLVCTPNPALRWNIRTFITPKAHWHNMAHFLSRATETKIGNHETICQYFFFRLFLHFSTYSVFLLRMTFAYKCQHQKEFSSLFISRQPSLVQCSTCLVKIFFPWGQKLNLTQMNVEKWNQEEGKEKEWTTKKKIIKNERIARNQQWIIKQHVSTLDGDMCMTNWSDFDYLPLEQ